MNYGSFIGVWLERLASWRPLSDVRLVCPISGHSYRKHQWDVHAVFLLFLSSHHVTNRLGSGHHVGFRDKRKIFADNNHLRKVNAKPSAYRYDHHLSPSGLPVPALERPCSIS
jgi:hypothetical protein